MLKIHLVKILGILVKLFHHLHYIWDVEIKLINLNYIVIDLILMINYYQYEY